MAAEESKDEKDPGERTETETDTGTDTTNNGDNTGGGSGGQAPGPATPTVGTLLPALLAIGGLVVVIGAALALVGASETDLESMTRGAPWPTWVGASLLLIAVIAAGAGALFPSAQKWVTVGAYAAATVGLILYVAAAIHVTSDPPAPQIKIEPVLETEGTKVTATAFGLAFNERLQLNAAFAGDSGLPFVRRVLGAGDDGKIEHTFIVPAQSASRRLQVTANILRQEEIVRDFQCNAAEAGRTCAEAAAVIQRGMPEVRSGLRRGVLRISVLDQRRIPGLLAVRVTRRGKEIYATQTRVSKPVFRTALKLRARPAGGKQSRDTVCVAASYGSTLPACGEEDSESVVRLYPSRTDLVRR